MVTTAGARIAALLQRVALVQLQRYGGAVVFVADTAGTGYDEETDAYAVPPGTTTFAGRGIQVTAQRQKYAPGTLYEQSTEVLIVAHDLAWTVTPKEGQQVTWYGGKLWKVLAADPVAPEGGTTVYWTVGLVAGA